MRMKSLVAVIAAALIMAGCAGSSGDAAPSADGITVHGDWTLDVYNADGTLDHSVDFHNEVVQSGLVEIVSALEGNRVVGDWSISLDSDSGPADGPCLDAGVPAACTATATTNMTISSIVSLNLDATVTAERDGVIGLAASFVDSCHPNATGCPTTMTTTAFSEKAIRDTGGVQYSVSEGQTIQVNVQFSFTSG